MERAVELSPVNCSGVLYLMAPLAIPDLRYTIQVRRAFGSMATCFLIKKRRDLPGGRMLASELVIPRTLLAIDNTRQVVCESMDNQFF